MKILNPVVTAILLCIALGLVMTSRNLTNSFSNKAAIGKKVSESLVGLHFTQIDETPFDDNEFLRKEYLRGYEDGWHQGLITATRYKDRFFVAIYEPHHELSPYEQGEVDGWGSTFEFAEVFRKKIPEEIRIEAMEEFVRRLKKSASQEALKDRKK